MGWGNPVGNLFVIDDPFAEKPLPVHLYHFILIVPIGIEARTPVGIVVSVVEPVSSSDSLVSIDFQNDVGDIMAPGGRIRALGFFPGLPFFV